MGPGWHLHEKVYLELFLYILRCAYTSVKNIEYLFNVQFTCS